MQYTLATLKLTMWVALKASDTGINNAPFPISKNNQTLLKNELILLINTYFLSKYRINDNTFSIAEVTALIQKTYTGVLGFLDTYFLDTTQTPNAPVSYITRTPGINFQITNSSFTFTLNAKS
jgi:hypothetical protein